MGAVAEIYTLVYGQVGYRHGGRSLHGMAFVRIPWNRECARALPPEVAQIVHPHRLVAGAEPSAGGHQQADPALSVGAVLVPEVERQEAEGRGHGQGRTSDVHLLGGQGEGMALGDRLRIFLLVEDHELLLAERRPAGLAAAV